MAKAKEQPALETEKQAAELAAMLRMLELSSGCFSLSIAVCNSPALRDHLIEKLRSSRPDIQVVGIPTGTEDMLAQINRHIDTSKCTAVFVVGVEESLSSSEARHPVVRHLNASRELLERDLHCPVVIWLPDFAAGILAREAPDLWRYRSHRFEFVSEQATLSAGLHDRTSGDIDIASNLSADEKHFRIAELEQRIKEAGPSPDKQLIPHITVWLDELAFLYRTLGELDRAEQTVLRALALDEGCSDRRAISVDYGHLGTVYAIRGDLGAAEEMFRKALALGEELGDKGGMASNYGNLAIICGIKGDLVLAEELHRKSLAIYEETGDKVYIATESGNLASVYYRRGDLDAAEEMLCRALSLSKELGSQAGMARQYGNLGNIHADRGDVFAAEKAYSSAIALFEELGAKDEMAEGNQNLGLLYLEKGDLAAAETMLRKALGLYRDMGNERAIQEIEDRLRGLAASS